MSTASESARPGNHYELLKLKPFEPDPAVIRKHFHKLIEQVRIKLGEDPTSQKWRQAQADMTGAMLVLLDARRKAEYDASIGGKASREPKIADLERIVKARKVLDDAALDKAKKFADTLNIELYEAIVNQKLASAETIVPLYADSLGLPFVDLADLTIDESLVPTVPAVFARQNSLTPVLNDEGMIVVASPKPLKLEVEEQLRLRFNAPIRQVIVTKSAIDEAINKHYPREAAAAQMSQAPQAASGAARSTQKAGGGGDSPRLTKAELKQKRLKIGGIAGMFTFFVSVVFSLFVMQWGAGENFPITVYAGAAGVGLIAFGVGYLATSS